ncbi:stressosome-associated protein Prli42 [Paraliobacillus salinarum]|uniref:stressosome-associated protein Prli42 n=1 Tax=Paraliobacillus salinarum TaxID=1158996 RepID=UPI0015F43BC1|nr:stressosome-associated protein Prli42 [Paraliobacillus salinarum]
MAKSTNQNKQTGNKPKKQSKRQRRNKIIVYLMIAAMVLSTFTAGLSFLINS